MGAVFSLLSGGGGSTATTSTDVFVVFMKPGTRHRLADKNLRSKHIKGSEDCYV